MSHSFRSIQCHWNSPGHTARHCWRHTFYILMCFYVDASNICFRRGMRCVRYSNVRLAGVMLCCSDWLARGSPLFLSDSVTVDLALRFSSEMTTAVTVGFTRSLQIADFQRDIAIILPINCP